MTREEAEEYAKEMTYRDAVCNALQGKCIPYRKATLIKLYELLDRLEQEPCEDAINREDALMALTGEWTEITDEIIHRFIKRIKALPPVNPQSKAEQFAKWVAGEIFDDMWEYNKDAFAEIACRKLAKLGIVIRMGDEWELIDPQESEDDKE